MYWRKSVVLSWLSFLSVTPIIRRESPDQQERQPQIAHFIQQAVQRRLVNDRAGQQRMALVGRG